MKRRPLIVSIVGWLFIATGTIGLVYHLSDVKMSRPFQSELAWISLVRVLAIISGVYLLLGRSWARWLALAWITFHVVISFFHSWQQVVVHVLFFVLVAYCLHRPEARAYFDRREDASA